MTKRIPAEKYERFAKKRSTDGATLLNNLRVKTARAKKELKTLRAEYEVLMEKQGKITVNDCKLAQMKNQELFRKLGEAQQLMDEMKVYKSEFFRVYYIIRPFGLSSTFKTIGRTNFVFKASGVNSYA